MRYVILFVSCLLLAGCLPQTKVKQVSVAYSDTIGVTALTYPVELRGVYVKQAQDGRLHLCAEPAPDAARQLLSDVMSKAKVTVPEGPQVEAELAAQLRSLTEELSGRTNTLLLARELLYRACEYSFNYPDDADRLVLYKAAIEQIKDIAAADRSFREEKLKKAEAEATDAKTRLLDLPKLQGLDAGTLKNILEK